MQNRRDFIKKAGLFSTGLIASGCMAYDKRQAKPSSIKNLPDIILISADDLGIQLGCYGDKQARTPNLDQLAENGVRFETAWVTQASCSPSRSSIYTGLFPHQNGQIGLSHRGYSMNDAYAAIPSVLKQYGYRTGQIGKFHVEPESLCPFDFKYRDGEVCFRQRDVRVMNQKAEQFIMESDEPFFLMYNHVDPHRPFGGHTDQLPEKPFKAEEVNPLPHLKLDSPDVRQETSGYYN